MLNDGHFFKYTFCGCSCNHRLLSVFGPDLSVSIRGIHLSAISYDSESKVEKTVKALKEKQEELVKKHEQPANLDIALPVKKSLGQRILDEIKHYYHGFRLLFIDIKVSARLLWHVLNGHTLSRRERKQVIVECL